MIVTQEPSPWGEGWVRGEPMGEANKIHVILVPGADALTFEEDIACAAERGATFDALTLGPIEGHPIDGRKAYFDAVADRIAECAAGAGEAKVFGIGRNHGGSILAYAAARDGGFDGLIFPGVIPALSDYRAHSDLPSARAFRAELDGPAEVARILELRAYDMDTCLDRIDPAKCLIQVGDADDWMDEASMALFRDLETRFALQWLADDHAMAAPATVAARWDFIEDRAKISAGVNIPVTNPI